MGAFAPTDPELIGIFDLNNRNALIEKAMGGYGLQDSRLEKEVRMIAQVGDRAHG